MMGTVTPAATTAPGGAPGADQQPAARRGQPVRARTACWSTITAGRFHAAEFDEVVRTIEELLRGRDRRHRTCSTPRWRTKCASRGGDRPGPEHRAGPRPTDRTEGRESFREPRAPVKARVATAAPAWSITRVRHATGASLPPVRAPPRVRRRLSGAAWAWQPPGPAQPQRGSTGSGGGESAAPTPRWPTCRPTTATWTSRPSFAGKPIDEQGWPILEK